MRKINKVLGIDIDGVVADFGNTILRYMKQINPKAELNDIIEYGFDNMGINAKELHTILKNFEHTKEYLSMRVIPHAVEVTRKLFKNNEIYFISARDQYKGVVDDTFTWLRNNHFQSDGLICGQRDKYPIVKKLGIDLVIEDNPDQIIELSKKGIECICFDQPWNQNLKIVSNRDRVLRIKDWREFPMKDGKIFTTKRRQGCMPVKDRCEWKSMDEGAFGFYNCEKCDGMDKDCDCYHVYNPSARRMK